MKNLEYKIRALKLSEEVNSLSTNFGMYKPYVRIVKSGDIKIAKVLTIVEEGTTVEYIKHTTEIADTNPSTQDSNIHCIININFTVNAQETNTFKILEIELKKDKVLQDHFNDINSFMIVSCQNKSTILGTMTIASYQNGGSFDPPPLINND
ncbi:hypothetical protein [uncultured Polaribacter sp.]|uniref:hypothetical protein n=1 Tax=uncultured Polaribacter sp. TaxID=174711 RepID=UPI00261A7D69|nr:hypothetical protein [uncultured Polaribacter sp.]